MRKEYTRKEVAAKIGISDRTVWFYTEKGLVIPEINNPSGRGTTRKYSAKNILEILVIRELVKYGFNLGTVKHIMTFPRMRGSDGFDPWDPESPVKSDRRYCLVALDPDTDHGKLILTSNNPGDLPALPLPGYVCAITIDLTSLREKLV